MDKAYNLSNLEALFRDYLLAENTGLNPTTIKNYCSDLRHFIGWIKTNVSSNIGVDDPAELFNEDTVKKYLKYLDTQESPIKTVNRRLSTIRKFLQFCSSNQILPPSKPVSFKNVTNVIKVSPIEKTTESISKPNQNHFIYSFVIFAISTFLFLFISSKLSVLIGAPKASTFPSVQLKTGRVFAFQGRLTDSLGNVLTSSTPIQFRLYNSPTSTIPLYQSGSCSIIPDRNGFFSVLIGGVTLSPPPPQDTCGKEVGAQVFIENSNLYLGMVIGSDKEMKPRQQIANVGYAANSETLRGLPIGSSESNIPYIAPDGSIVLSLNSPSIISTYESGSFSIKSGSDLLFQTANEGNITLAATGSGSIMLKANGGSIEVDGNIGPELSGVYDLGSRIRLWNDVYADRLCFDGSSDCVTSSLGIFSALDTSSETQLKIKGALVSGSGVTSGTTTLDIGGTTTAYALCHSSQSGTDNERLVDCGSTPTADFAEMYPVEKDADFGDVMTLGGKIVETSTGDEIRELVKSHKPYDNHVIGIVSDNFDDFISVGHNINSKDNPMPIALKGRVPARVSQSSPIIQAGDYLTTSTEAGAVTKAEADGVVVGRALESWEPGTVKSRIMVFVGIDYVVQSQSQWRKFADTFGTFFANKIVTPVVETSEINPTKGEDVSINLAPNAAETSSSPELSKLLIKGIKKAVVASIDAEGNIKSDGIIEAKNGVFKDSIKSDRIEGKTIDSLNENINDVQTKLKKLSESSAQTTSVFTIPSESLDSIVHESLISHLVVTESADIYNLSVQERIQARSDYLTLSAGTGVRFFDNSVSISRDGNIVTAGSITAKELIIQGSDGISVASINATGSARFNKLNLPKDAGSSIIPEEENEVKVYHSGLTASSLIYLTLDPANEIVDKPIMVKEKYICAKSESDCINYFTVAIATNNHKDLRFNWLIIN